MNDVVKQVIEIEAAKAVAALSDLEKGTRKYDLGLQRAAKAINYVALQEKITFEEAQKLVGVRTQAVGVSDKLTTAYMKQILQVQLLTKAKRELNEQERLANNSVRRANTRTSRDADAAAIAAENKAAAKAGLIGSGGRVAMAGFVPTNLSENLKRTTKGFTFSKWATTEEARINQFKEFIKKSAEEIGVGFKRVGQALKSVETKDGMRVFNPAEINEAVAALKAEEAAADRATKASDRKAASDKKRAEAQSKAVAMSKADVAAMKENLARSARSFVATNGTVTWPSNVENTMRQMKMDNPSATYNQIASAMRDAGVSSDTLSAALARLNKNQDTANDATKAHRESLRRLDAEMNKLAAKPVNRAGQFTGAGSWLDNLTGMTMPNQIDAVKKKIVEIKAATGSTFNEIATQMKKAGVEAQVLNRAMSGIPGAAKEVGHGIDFIRTALGTLSAMLIFNVINVFTQFFTDSIQNARKLHSELIQLNFAEAILSKKGMDITRQELDEFVAYIEEKYKYLTKIEATSIVSEVATATAEFNVSKKQILELADAVAFIQLKQKMMGEEAADAGSIINAAMDARSNYFNKLGVNITETLVKEKAYAMGLATTGSELDKNIRFQAILALLTEQTSEKAQDLTDALDGTREGLELIANQDWTEATTMVGNFFETVKAGALGTYVALKNMAELILNTLKPGLTLLSNIKLPSWMTDFMKGAASNAALAIMNTIPLARTAYELFQKGRGLKTETPDTSTGAGGIPAIDETQAVEDAGDKIDDAFKKLKEDIEKANRDLENDKFEARLDLNFKIQDINTKYSQKLQDLARDYAQKVEDINRDFRDKVADINRESQQEEYEKQLEYNQKEVEAARDRNEELLRLREDYLMDLQDALYENDARAILKLMQQYQLDKDRINRTADDEAKSRAENFKAEQAQRARQREQRLAEARLEQQRKLQEAQIAYARERAEAAISRQRELEEANRDFARKMAEIQRQHQRELQELGNSLKAQFNLTAQQAEALQQMLAGNLNAYSAYLQQVVSRTTAAMSALGISGSKFSGSTLSGGTTAGTTSSTSGGLSSIWGAISGIFSNINWGGWNANGGSFMVNKPTLFGAGENGSEAVSILPLNRSRTSGSGGMGGGVGEGGSVSIELLMSPDLEARIVNTTLDKTANVVMRTVRSR